MMLKGVLFIFFFILFPVFYHQTSLFLQNLKIQIEYTILALILSHLYEENPFLCSTIEPLYCSSHAMVVGGIRFINIVDSGTPTGTTYQYFMRNSNHAFHTFTYNFPLERIEPFLSVHRITESPAWSRWAIDRYKKNIL